MTRRRFFSPSSTWHEHTIVLDRSQSHHVTTVLRLIKGDCLICFDEVGRQVDTTIESIRQGSVTLAMIAPVRTVNYNGLKLTLAQSLIKSSNMDLLIQKSVELGVHRIIPFISSFSIIKLEPKRRRSKLVRWEKIVIEAVQQCNRNDIPSISDICSFDSLLETFDEYDRIFVADPYSDMTDISTDINMIDNALVLVGPEGGFSPAERHVFMSFSKCRLFKYNTNILRAETAAIGILAILQYEGLKGKK